MMKKATKKIGAGLMALALCVSCTVPSWAAEDKATAAADALVRLRLFRGMDDGNLNLEQEPTRIQTCVMLLRFMGLETAALDNTAETPFSDLAQWHRPYVGYAYENHLTRGMTETTFEPDRPSLSKQYATFLLRALGYREDAGDFTYDTALQKAREVGIFAYAGVPEEPFTRGDMVNMSFSALNLCRVGESLNLISALVHEGILDQSEAVLAGFTITSPNELAPKTTITFDLPPEGTYSMSVSSAKAVLTLIGTQGMEGAPVVAQNSLFSSVEPSPNTASQYTLTLNRTHGFYGYRTEYAEGKITFIFKNPTILAKGAKPLTGVTLVVDAGHGGSDPGAPARGSELKLGDEKDLNLKVALALNDRLVALGAKVIMTRTTDQTLSLAKRREIIMNTDPALSVSVHHNSMPEEVDGSLYSGTLGFYTMDFSKRLAVLGEQAINRQFPNRKSHGTRAESLAVTRITHCPSMLFELGFMCNPAEYEFLAQDATIQGEADAISQAMLTYLQQNQ